MISLEVLCQSGSTSCPSRKVVRLGNKQVATCVNTDHCVYTKVSAVEYTKQIKEITQ